VKTKQAPVTEVKSIESAQLEEVLGGCNCGCGMASCNCTSGSCQTGATASSYRRPFGFARR
jgi:hypothetical protein